MTNLPWSAGSWTHRPVKAVERSGDLVVTAAEGSDAWRLTSYGFIHDSEHALLAPFPQPDLVASAGPFICSPTRAGLTVPFHAWRVSEPDEGLH